MNTNRSTCILKHILFLILFISVYIKANAQDHPFAGGTGTKSDPYQIATERQLDDIRFEYLDDHYILIEDLDFTDYQYRNETLKWIPIGQGGRRFSGTFNGNNHTISNLIIDYSETNSPSPIGLFSELDLGTEVKSLTLKNIDFASRSVMGGIAGRSHGALIENCEVSGKLSGLTHTAGIVGVIGSDRDNFNMLFPAIVRNCSSNIEITAFSVIGISQGGGDLGGIVGNFARFGLIENCASTGQITGILDKSRIGGIAGVVIGGLNFNDESFGVKNCYSSVSMSEGSFIGGVVGLIFSAFIENCYATGTIANSSRAAGGLIASIVRDEAFSSYWDIETTGIPFEDYGNNSKGLTTEQLYDADNYTGWDFENIWYKPIPGKSFPLLRTVGQQLPSIEFINDFTYSTTGVSVNIQTEVAGKVYFGAKRVEDSSPTTLSEIQSLEGSGNILVEEAGVNTLISLENLNSGTSYEIYAIITNENDQQLSFPSSSDLFFLNPLSTAEGVSNNITVFPNPSKGIYTISMDNHKNLELQLFSLSGEKILDIVNKTQLDITYLPKGIYILRSTDRNEGSLFTTKIIKQ